MICRTDGFSISILIYQKGMYGCSMCLHSCDWDSPRNGNFFTRGISKAIQRDKCRSKQMKICVSKGTCIPKYTCIFMRCISSLFFNHLTLQGKPKRRTQNVSLRLKMSNGLIQQWFFKRCYFQGILFSEKPGRICPSGIPHCDAQCCNRLVGTSTGETHGFKWSSWQRSLSNGFYSKQLDGWSLTAKTQETILFLPDNVITKGSFRFSLKPKVN